MHVTYPVHLILLDLIVIIVSDEQYKYTLIQLDSSNCIWRTVQVHVEIQLSLHFLVINSGYSYITSISGVNRAYRRVIWIKMKIILMHLIVDSQQFVFKYFCERFWQWNTRAHVQTAVGLLIVLSFMHCVQRRHIQQQQSRHYVSIIKYYDAYTHC
jgi:hypothetical protein